MVFIHGDDFAVCGELDVLTWVKEKIARRCSTKGSGFGHAAAPIDVHRVTSWPHVFCDHNVEVSPGVRAIPSGSPDLFNHIVPIL